MLPSTCQITRKDRTRMDFIMKMMDFITKLMDFVMKMMDNTHRKVVIGGGDPEFSVAIRAGDAVLIILSVLMQISSF